MQAIVNSNVLKSIVKTYKGTCKTGTRGAGERLGTVTLTPEGNGIRLDSFLHAHFFGFSARFECPDAVLDGNPVTVMGKDLEQAVKAMPKNMEIDMETTGPTVILNGTGKSKLMTHDLEGWGVEKPVNPEVVLSMTGNELASMCEKVLPFVAVDDPRIFLNGALFENHGGKLRIVATQGNSLYLKDYATEYGHETNQEFQQNQMGVPEGELEDRARWGCQPGIIIPWIPLQAVAKLFKGKDQVATLSIGDNARFIFACDGIEIFGGSIEGDFPDYDMVVPKSNLSHFSVNTKRFAEVLKKADPFTCERNHGVLLTLNPDDCTIKVRSSDPNAGEFEEVMPCAFGGMKEHLEIGVNLRFILDSMQSLGYPETAFHYSDYLSPFVARGIWHAEGQLPEELVVIMPMRI